MCSPIFKINHFLTESEVHLPRKWVRTFSHTHLNKFHSPVFMIYPNLPKFLIDDVILDFETSIPIFLGISRKFYVEIHSHDMTYINLISPTFPPLFKVKNGHSFTWYNSPPKLLICPLGLWKRESFFCYTGN